MDALAATEVRTPVFAFSAAEIEVERAQRRAQWRVVCEDGTLGFANVEFQTWLSVGAGTDENVYQTRYGVPAGKQLPQEAGARWSPFNNSQLEKWILRADLNQKFMWADDQDVEVAADPGCRAHVFEVVTTATG